MPAPVSAVHLAVALDGAGWHPAAWREPTARPAELLDALGFQSVRQFVGSPAQVADQLEQLCDATGADELIITTITHDHADLVRSYALLAEEWSRR
jgi:alkanesulfonate monooxygenase SsuD/methylene tetrahydromethanopterin reductase-like flavin-dependent oxidoreductase (luciferase family)